jgi:hypothetical protein
MFSEMRPEMHVDRHHVKSWISCPIKMEIGVTRRCSVKFSNIEFHESASSCSRVVSCVLRTEWANLIDAAHGSEYP